MLRPCNSGYRSVTLTSTRHWVQKALPPSEFERAKSRAGLNRRRAIICRALTAKGYQPAPSTTMRLTVPEVREDQYYYISHH
jgi:hypothetical protein